MSDYLFSIDKNYDFKPSEGAVLDFWDREDIFRKTVERNKEKGKGFVFYDGPPTANGKPHIGHVLTRVVKDVIPRYKTMKGYHVERKAGWDTHGLPVELEVEKKIGTNGKDDIEKYGVESFISECRKSVWTYKEIWEEMSRQIGFWCDYENPYITYDNKYIESVWWAFKEMDKKNLLYKGFRVSPYCSRCATALSSHEVAQGYKNIKTRSIFVQFACKDEPDTYFAVWTTTPWTLLSNVGLCVNVDSGYCKILVDGAYYYVAEELIDGLFSEYEAVAKMQGRDLLNKEYVPMFDYAVGTFPEKAHYVVGDDYVSTDSGTGIVHLAPAFGEDDARVGRKYSLPCVNLVDTNGNFTEICGEYAGKNVLEHNDEIIKNLKRQNMVISTKNIEHSYPHCWRCHEPLIYYAKDSWFIAMETQRDKLVANNRSVNWFPGNFKEGRMGNFVSNVIDWAVTRDRYWGTPFPVWVCGNEACQHHHVVGSIAELVELTGAPEDTDLHKPAVDGLTMECQKCGGVMRRTPEVCDCWLDSGSMPFAQLHYPFENKDLFDKQFPADFISEGSDQSRGWFYALQAISTVLFDKSPYKNCIALGLVNDEKGVKMSKHIGNVVSPQEVLDEFGSDATRLYFCIANAPWVSTSFSKKTLSEFRNKFISTLWQSAYFYTLYRDIDKFDPSAYRLEDCKLRLIDRWALSRVNSLVEAVTDFFDRYLIFEAVRAVNEFIDELSNWYIRRNRVRFFNAKMDEDKLAAYMTLYTTLEILTRLAAPVIPFMAERLYNGLTRVHNADLPISVHLTDYPESQPQWSDKALEEQMEIACEIVAIGRKLREQAGIRIRQPLSECRFQLPEGRLINEQMCRIISEELNIDNVRAEEDLSSLIVYEIKPNLKTLGPKYGALLNQLRNYFHVGINGGIVRDIQEKGVYCATIDGVNIELSEEDILVTEQTSDGYVMDSGRNITVVLNTTLDDELIKRGCIREFISKVQNYRKVQDFDVTDRIILTVCTNDSMRLLLEQNHDYVCGEVLANRLSFSDAIEDGSAFSIEGATVTFSAVVDNR